LKDTFLNAYRGDIMKGSR